MTMEQATMERIRSRLGKATAERITSKLNPDDLVALDRSLDSLAIECVGVARQAIDRLRKDRHHEQAR